MIPIQENRGGPRPSDARSLSLAIVAGACIALPALLPGEVRGQTQNGAEPTRQTFVADSLDAPPAAVPTTELGRDTVVANPGVTYSAGPLHRFLFGDLNRDLWELEFPVPVLDLDEVGGGLEVEELSGGLQTLGLRFVAKDGRTFQFRSMVKNAGRALPGVVEATPVEAVVQDQMGALFPLSAMVVAELVDAAGLLVAKPRPVIMPDDPRLGEYREAFAGRMGWIEERPNEASGDRPGFAGSSKVTGTDELLEELREEPRSYVNATQLLKARLIDMLVNDWDRHQDQWRWASFEEGDRIRWDPIPRDRDWALARIDGVLPAIARIYSPKYRGFSDALPNAFRMAWSAQEIDRRLLTGLDRSAFESAAAELAADLNDDAIEAAVGVLPESYLEVVGEKLTVNLKRRRDHLPRLASDFYELLARWVDVFGTDRPDDVVVSVPAANRMRVQIRAPGPDGVVIYDRTFLKSETDQVRLYLMDGDDAVLIHGAPEIPIDLRVVGAGGDDRYRDETDGERVHVYDSEGANEFDLGPDAYRTESPFKGQDEPRWPYLIWDTRDWGHAWVPRPALRYDSNLGLYAGVEVARFGFGFGHDPYRSRYSVSILSDFEPDQWIGDVSFERTFGDRGWRAGLDVDWYTERPTWLFGFGNETRLPESRDFFRSSRNQATIELSARWAPDSTFTAELGPTATLSGHVEDVGNVFANTDAYGTDVFHQLGLRAAVRFDERDSYSLPRRGYLVQATAKAFPAILDVVEPFGRGEVDARTYFGLDAPLQPALHLRLHGAHAVGLTPFGELPSLGGETTLPGYVERRFVGQSAVSASGLLRLRIAPLRIGTDIDFGIHGLGAVGRVWLDGEASDRWHPAFGGGIWLHVPAMDRTASLTHVRGRDGSGAFYLNLGFPF